MLIVTRVLLLLVFIGICNTSFCQPKLTQEEIASKLRSRYWSANLYGIKNWGIIYYRSDSIKWDRGVSAMFFKNDGTFREGGSRCYHDRKPYVGKWHVSNDTLYFVPDNGKTFRYKVLDVSSQKLVLKF